MKTPEAFEKDRIKQYLKKIGAWYFCPFMAGRGQSGVPDIIACIDGKLWGIEAKQPSKSPTKLQEVMLNRINASGGCSVCGTAEIVIAAIEWWRHER